MSDDIPIFITCRDRLTPLVALLDWLEGAGYRKIILVDNASTYQPLCQFLKETRHTVIQLAENLGHLAPWISGAVKAHALNNWYVVTDPDVVPIPQCPADLVERLRHVLLRYPAYVKAGCALCVDDLPSSYKFADTVRRWEVRFWRRRFGEELYDADVDTTFALYRPFTPEFRFRHGPSIRVGFPYIARHLPWYTDSQNPTEEECFYQKHATLGVSNWNLVAPPVNVQAASEERLKEMYEWFRWRLRLVFPNLENTVRRVRQCLAVNRRT